MEHPNKLNKIPIDKLNFWFLRLSRHPQDMPPKKVMIIAPYPSWNVIAIFDNSDPAIQGTIQNKANGIKPIYPYVDLKLLIFMFI